MIRETFAVGPLQCNCSILADEENKEAIVVDPGDEVERIANKIEELGLAVKAIIHTHAHIDHIGATAELAALTGAPTFLHDEDQFLHQMLEQQAMMIGLSVPKKGNIDRGLTDEQRITFGKYELGVLHTPGHTPGSVCFSVPGEDLCFSGDTLFFQGIGRTDLWGGDFGALESSIRDRLYSLNSAVEVIPGHGPNTTIDREKLTNPFVRLRA